MGLASRRAWVVLLGVLAGCPASGTSPTDTAHDDATAEAGDGVEGADADADADGHGDETSAEDVATDDAADDGGADVCTSQPELCNGLDDDCDGMTDEDFDLSTSLDNCGECGAQCYPTHGSGECQDGVCRVVSCDDGWVDANGAAADGCEYACVPTGEENPGAATCADGLDNDCDGRTDATDPGCEVGCIPELCNHLDDDCDGLTDEDFDLDFDPLNCGGCGRACPVLAHAVPRCVLGSCEFDCAAGWSDLDGQRWNGCESSCTPGADTSETACNGVDDNCDGRTDENFVPTSRCGVGACRRPSYCFHGAESCTPRDPPAATDTTCDHVDDDCDGSTDEDTTCTCYENGDCDDGNLCNGVETCNPGVACIPGTPVSCDDGVACTIDHCNPMDGSCTHTPNDAACNDGNPCNGVETCGAGGCLAGTPQNCDDGIPCTVDSCNPLDGSCIHAPVDATCSDGIFCNGAERCDVARGCVSGTPPTCSDGILCTDDRCSSSTDSCVNTPVNARCDDGQFCNGAEVCVAGTGCQPGTAPHCDDGLSCTSDTCNPGAGGGAGACVYTPPDADGDGFAPLSCTGTDCDDTNYNIHPGAPDPCNGVDDNCNGTTDDSYECAQGHSGSCMVGMCSGVRTCSAACTWGTCSVLASEVCNGIDDNCNGATDEIFSCVMNATAACTVTVATKTCSGTKTCVGPSCTWGPCVIPETGSNLETCNGVDDDCNGIVDDAPPAPSVLCPAVPNATVACSSGSCRITGCSGTYFDTNGTYGDGCECLGEASDASSASCSASALPVGSCYDSTPCNYTLSGKLPTAGDVDCYSFTANDSADSSADLYHVDIRFTGTGNPSTQFKFNVFRGTCSSQVCASTVDYYDWYVDQYPYSCVNATGTSPCGEGHCSTSSIPGYNLCINDTSSYWFCVSRVGSTATCDSYQIQVSNGVY